MAEKKEKGKEAMEDPNRISWKHESIRVRDQGRVQKELDKVTETSKPPSEDTPSQGACWALSVVTLVAHQHRIETIQQQGTAKSSASNPLYPSFQHIVDHCTTNRDKEVYTKKVSEVERVLQYVKDKGVCLELDYPTIHHLPGPPTKSGRSIPKKPKVFIKNYVPLRSDEIAFENIKEVLKNHVLLGKIAIHDSLVHFPKEPDYVYTEDIGECKGKHCIVIVGCGTKGTDDYYELQNSWGPDWGNGGFGKVKSDC